jgi:hypothetical protein
VRLVKHLDLRWQALLFWIGRVLGKVVFGVFFRPDGSGYRMAPVAQAFFSYQFDRFRLSANR